MVQASGHTNPVPVEKQLAACIKYPSFIKNFNEGILVISFQVNSENKIAAIQVHSDNQQLNSFIIQSLLNKSLHLAGFFSSTKQVARIRFRSNKNN